MSDTPPHRSSVFLGLAGWPWHTAAVAFYVPLWFVSGNPDLFRLEHIVRPALLLLVLILALSVVLYPLYRDVRRATLSASLTMGLLLCYAPVRLWLFNDYAPTIARGLATGSVVVVALVLGVLIHRFPAPARRAAPAFNLAMAVLISFPLVTALGNRDESVEDNRAEPPELLRALSGAENRAGDPGLPTIHHIALDGYGRGDVLRELYAHDNSPFVDALKSMGFAVPSGSVTPYGQTLLTMNAIFSMRYLDRDLATFTAARPGIRPKAVRQTLHNWFVRSPARRILETAGYHIAAVEGAYPPLSMRPVDSLISPDIPWSSSTLLGRTVYGMTPFGGAIIHGLFDGRSDTSDSVRFAFETDIAESLPRPAFIYRHVLSPHPPFDIDRNGNGRYTTATGFADGDQWSPGRPGRAEAYRAGYVEKLMYTNNAVLAQVRRIIAQADGPTVIVIHGDHGGGIHLRHDDFDGTCAKERFSPLLAVYASDPVWLDGMSDEVNLVNVYRILFNGIFDAELPLLDDRSYFAPWNDPTGLVEIDRERRDLYDANCGVMAGEGDTG